MNNKAFIPQVNQSQTIFIPKSQKDLEIANQVTQILLGANCGTAGVMTHSTARNQAV